MYHKRYSFSLSPVQSSCVALQNGGSGWLYICPINFSVQRGSLMNSPIGNLPCVMDIYWKMHSDIWSFEKGQAERKERAAKSTSRRQPQQRPALNDYKSATRQPVARSQTSPCRRATGLLRRRYYLEGNCDTAQDLLPLARHLHVSMDEAAIDPVHPAHSHSDHSRGTVL